MPKNMPIEMATDVEVPAPKAHHRRNVATESSRPSDVALPTLGKITLGGFPFDIDYYLKTEYQSARNAAQELPSVVEWVNGELQIAIFSYITSASPPLHASVLPAALNSLRT